MEPLRPATGATASSAGAAVTPRTVASNVPLTPAPGQSVRQRLCAGSTREQLAGAWTLAWDAGQHTCPVTLTTDRGASGLAARADVSCPSEIFMTKGWDVMGSEHRAAGSRGQDHRPPAAHGPNRYTGILSENNQANALDR